MGKSSIIENHSMFNVNVSSHGLDKPMTDVFDIFALISMLYDLFAELCVFADPSICLGCPKEEPRVKSFVLESLTYLLHLSDPSIRLWWHDGEALQRWQSVRIMLLDLLY